MQLNEFLKTVYFSAPYRIICKSLPSLGLVVINIEMWKYKRRTGGIRRKITAEYLRILNRDTGNTEQATRLMNNESRGSEILERQGSRSANVCVEGRADLDEQSSASIQQILEDSGSVSCSNDTEHECVDSSNVSENSDSDSVCNEYDKQEKFRENIRKWAIEKNIAHTALRDLTKIINEFIPNTLPNDPRTILATPRQTILKIIDGGEYWHNGILIPLQKILLSWEEAPETISLNINMDGLPIFKSTKKEFWPILCNVFENPCFRPFVIGIYYGIGKPQNLNTYLEDFINDMETLLREGIYLPNSGRRFTIKIRCFICDSPARAFIKGVCNFNGKNGCLKCVTVGEYSHTSHTVVFPDSRCADRTDDGFRNKIYGAHHKTDSPLLRLPIDMVNNFPVSDSLHLIDLGIMKRLLIGWRDGNFGKFITKWRATEIETVTNFLDLCKLPFEIHRSVRNLNFLAYWKASEFRSFFYYLSLVILPDVLPSNAFSHFLMLYCGITICSSETYHLLLPLAEKLLRYYVEHYKDFYGAAYVTSNVHNLLHVTAEVKMYGTLNTFSAYPFENKLHMIKQMLRVGKNPLSQVAKRLTEDGENSGINTYLERKKKTTYPFVSMSKKSNPILNFQDFRLSSKTEDRYLFTVHSDIFEISSITEELNVVFIKGYRLNSKEEVFEYPIKSSRLGIYKSKSLRIGDITAVVLDPKEVKYKFVCIPHREYYYFIPLMHTL